MDSSIKIISVAARSSALSRAQLEEVYTEITRYQPLVRFEPLWIETTGDRDLHTSLRAMDKTNFFTKEIDALQLSGGCRISIHSAKDLPDPLPLGLCIVALTRGVDASDVLVLRSGKGIADLPRGARIGTSSARREAAVHALRSDLLCVDIRGSIERRLSLLDAGHVDGVVMAEAALIRLKYTQRNRMKLPIETAQGQGQLVIIAREGDEEMKQLFACLDSQKGKKILYLGTDPEHFSLTLNPFDTLVHYPVIEIVPRPHDTVYSSLVNYTHILMTSKNAVRIFFEHLAELEIPLSEVNEKTWIVIGSQTAQCLATHLRPPDLIAEEETQEGLVALLQTCFLGDAYILLPHSALSRPVLRDFLKASGIAHYAYALYDTLPHQHDPIPDLREIDEIVFTSPSTVHSFRAIFGAIPHDKQLCAIGPITQEALESHLC